jgi:hypothetical protein
MRQSEALRNGGTMRQTKIALGVACAQKINGTNLSFMSREETEELESTSAKLQRQHLAKAKKRYMQARLSAEITDKPEGVTLAEIAERLGVAPVVLGRVSRDLLKRSKICKAGTVYFPANERR